MKRLKAQEFLSAKEYGFQHSVSEELVRRFCREGRIPGALKIKTRWVIPSDSDINGYAPRLKNGAYVGLTDLRKGDLERFFLKRGIV